MRKGLTPALLALGFCVVAPAAMAAAVELQDAAEATATHADETAIREVLVGYAAAVARSDIAGMEAFVDTSDAFSVFEGNHANWGWADYRDNHLTPEFASPDFRIRDYGIDDVRIAVGAPFAYATFRYRLRAEVKGEMREHQGLATVVLVKTPGGWKIRHEQS